MNCAVDENKHPDWRAHVSDAGPHAQHGACMVVRLQGRTTLALREDDQGVEDLVELADIEHPAPEGQPLIPQATNIGRIGIAIISHLNQSVLCLPDVDGRVIRRSVAKPSWTMDLAESVCHTCQTVRIIPDARPGMRNGSAHGSEGREGVGSQQDVVQHHEPLKWLLLGDPPWLVIPASVVRVEREDGDDVDGGEGEGNPWLERGVEEVLLDAER